MRRPTRRAYAAHRTSASRSVRRRDFLALLSIAAALWPRVSTAQDRRLPTVGVLVVGVPDPTAFLRAFREGLRETGYSEGHNIQLAIRSAEGQAAAPLQVGKDIKSISGATISSNSVTRGVRQALAELTAWPTQGKLK